MIPLASLMPGDASIFTDIGDLHFNLQEWEQSEQAYRRAINADPDRSAVLAKLIGIREAQGELSRGLQEIGDALQRFPEDASLHARRGSLLEKSGRVEEAFEAYGRAVEVSPELGEGYLGLARIHLARDRQDQARAVLQQAAGRIPNDPELQMRYAGFCEKESLDEQALHFYRSACHADPGLPGAYLGLARVQMNLGELDESLDTTRKGLQATPRSVELHQLQCELLKQSHRIPEMRRAVENAARTFPGNAEVLARQARVRDIFGYRAAEAYEGLLEALEAEEAPADRLEPVLERGLVVALRDGDRARAARMATRLSQLGRRDIPAIDPIARTEGKERLVGGPRRRSRSGPCSRLAGGHARRDIRFRLRLPPDTPDLWKGRSRICPDAALLLRLGCGSTDPGQVEEAGVSDPSGDRERIAPQENPRGPHPIGVDHQTVRGKDPCDAGHQ